MSVTEVVTWADVPIRVLLELAAELRGDGWTIYDPSYLRDKGVPDALVTRCTRYYGTSKGTITDTRTGRKVPGLRGVYSLDVLCMICRDLDLEVRDCYGRGSQAEACSEAIVAQIKELYERSALAGLIKGE